MEIAYIKNIIGIIAIVLTFVGYTPYFIDLWKGKTKPHIFSWFIWGIVTSIIFALQKSDGAGIGSYVTLAVALISAVIFFIGLKKGNRNIKKIDVVFLVLALIAIPLWLLAHQPVLSIILLSSIDMLGFAPTIRKSWENPYSETLSLYTITTFRHGLSLFALQNYSIVTVLFPATWVIANAMFATMLLIRRKQLVPK
ncbi:MAG: hypothetical protein RL641_40 [Candidatus Parcubacteria bacterium]|jgi:uncharacterized protein with PQ loop repeat